MKLKFLKIKEVLGNMLKLLKNVVSKVVDAVKGSASSYVSDLLSDVVSLVVGELMAWGRSKAVYTLQAFAADTPKFVKGPVVMGRVYFVIITADKKPPEEFKRSVYLGSVTPMEGITFYLWGNSAPKEKWEKELKKRQWKI